jgi:hypothetical protein
MLFILNKLLKERPCEPSWDAIMIAQSSFMVLIFWEDENLPGLYNFGIVSCLAIAIYLKTYN